MSVSSEQDQFSSCNAETLNKQSPVVFGSPQDFSSAEKGISAEDELILFLQRVEKDAIYLIEEVLKESDFEITQKVVSADSDGKKSRPLIRKYIDSESGLGSVYKTIYDAQQRGVSFTYLPQIYECYQLKDKLVVLMEYIQGETLQEILLRKGPSTWIASDVFPRICDAVVELHEKFDLPIIHRDLKPANIILSFDRLMLIDFGIARVYREDSLSDTLHFGTRDYAPPEQFGYGQTDVRSDVYALGMLLFFCLTGQVAGNQVRKDDFVYPGVPEQLRIIIKKACAFDPKDRYQSVRELCESFKQASESYLHDSFRAGDLIDGSDYPPPSGLPIMVSFDSNMEQTNKQSLFYPGSCNVRTAFKGCAEDIDQDTNPGVGVHSNSTLHKFLDSLRNVYRSSSEYLQKVPTWIGIVWDIWLLLCWIIFIAACCYSTFYPTDPTQYSYPLWYRAIGYILVFGVSFTSIVYALCDKRLLYSRFPNFKRLSFPLRLLVFVFVVPFTLGIVFIIATVFVVL